MKSKLGEGRCAITHAHLNTHQKFISGALLLHTSNITSASC